MSLLMDALRRAEAERRQLERAAPAGADTAAGAVPVSGADEPTVVAADATATSGAAVPEAAADDESLALDLSELTLAPLEVTYADLTGSPSTDATATGFGARGRRSEQTSTMPSNRARSSDMQAYFDQSQVSDGPRGTPLADMTLEDVAAHTVVGAQTVFAAGERPRRRGLAAAAIVLGVVLLLGAGVLAVFYTAQTRVPQYVPSPTVADGVEKPLPRALQVVPLEPPPAPAATILPRLELEPAAAVADSAAAPVAEVAAQVDPATASPGDSLPLPAPPAPLPAATAEPKATVAVANGDPTAAPARLAPPPPPPPAPSTRPSPEPPAAVIADVNAGELRIARNRPPASIDADIARAYAAFQVRDLAAADRYYRSVLAGAPRSRDALLGLAAVALERGDRDGAYRHYRQVLDEHPGDPVASAALFSLTGAGGDRGAAQLRLLIDTYPDLALLRFALGNWYAGAGRWADAQQAYFEAVRLDAVNADYTYNLAVALDRLGQHAAALGYYQKSLDLADRGATSFNPAVVLARIGSLAAPAP